VATEQQYGSDRRNVYRIFASIFVIGGGLFWAITVFVGMLNFPGSTVLRSVASGLVWVAVAVVVFIVGLFWEYVAAGLLGLALVGSLAYGMASQGFEPGVWGIWAVFLLLPIVISAVLYLLAGRERSMSERAAVSVPAS
jgi:hypothetical protein